MNRHVKSSFVSALAFIFLFSCCPAFLSAAAPQPEDPLRVVFLNVRQGDSTIILTPSGKTVLIDGGQSGTRYSPYDAGQETVVPMLKSLGVKKIDVLISTHPDYDHVGGLSAVLEELPVELIFDSGIDHTTETYQRFLELAREKKIPLRTPEKGEIIPTGDKTRIQVIAPQVPVKNRSNLDLNNNSIVVRVDHGDVSFLLAADAEHELENTIMNSGARVRAKILKTGHHGSRGATGADFFYLVNPEVAVISVGKRNKYDHPHWEVANRIREANAWTLRTDYHGNILISSDGKTYQVETYFGIDSPDE